MKLYKSRLSKAWPVLSMVLLVSACSRDYLNVNPIGPISGATLNNRYGVEGLLVGAYSLLDGVGANVGGSGTQDLAINNTYVSNVAADEAHKGGGYCCQTYRSEIENYTYNAFNGSLEGKWRAYYAGVQRANDVLRGLNNLEEDAFTADEIKQIVAEARFLRGIYHLEAAKMWRNVPYVDETIFFGAGNYLVKNDVSIWPYIEADFEHAAANLQATHSQAGRANSWAAKAFLAKTYMFQQKLAEAKPLLEDLINNGVTTRGQKYDLLAQYSWNFRVAHKNSAESVFAVQMSVNDGGEGYNGNAGDAWSFPMHLGGWGNQPSFEFVNMHKTDGSGLPMFGTYFNEDVKSDLGTDWDDPFVPYAGPLDPRLDWTVGRRTIPYHDWGLHRRDMIASPPEAGPYSPKKLVHWQEEDAQASSGLDGWMRANAMNYDMIRFADILLWAAEVEVEIGSLDVAQQYVNRIRARAANPDGFVYKYIDDNNPMGGFSNVPAANYEISQYPAGKFTTEGKEYAREAVRFERRIELGMEGHRFFDLQRYDALTPGYMKNTLMSYAAREVQSFRDHLDGVGYQILEVANFKQGQHEIYAIPQTEIDRSKDQSGTPTLTQNPGHN